MRGWVTLASGRCIATRAPPPQRTPCSPRRVRARGNHRLTAFVLIVPTATPPSTAAPAPRPRLASDSSARPVAAAIASPCSSRYCSATRGRGARLRSDDGRERPLQRSSCPIQRLASGRFRPFCVTADRRERALPGLIIGVARPRTMAASTPAARGGSGARPFAGLVICPEGLQPPSRPDAGMALCCCAPVALRDDDRLYGASRCSRFALARTVPAFDGTRLAARGPHAWLCSDPWRPACGCRRVTPDGVVRAGRAGRVRAMSVCLGRAAAPRRAGASRYRRVVVVDATLGRADRADRGARVGRG